MAAKYWFATKRSSSPQSLVGEKLGDIRKSLISQGINVIGMVEKNLDSGKQKKTHSNNNFPQMLLSQKNEEEILTEDKHLLYISDNEDGIYSAGWYATVAGISSHEHSNYDELSLPQNKRKKIVLVGSFTRCKAVWDLLHVITWVSISLVIDNEDKEANDNDENNLSVTVGEFSSENTWGEAKLQEADVVVFMSKQSTIDETQLMLKDQGGVDASVILAAKFAQKYLLDSYASGKNHRPKFVGEMLGKDNRGLFLDAGIDDVIPCNLLVERILTKLVYSRGYVFDCLIKLMTMDDTVHFLTQCLTMEDHSHLLGKTFPELLFGMPSGFQLIAVLPGTTNCRDNYENEKEDFSYHFLASPKLAEQTGYKSHVGDELVMIVDHKAWLNKST